MRKCATNKKLSPEKNNILNICICVIIINGERVRRDERSKKEKNV